MSKKNLEDEIKDIVQDAIDYLNFNQLSKDIEHTVESAIFEARSALGLDHKKKNKRKYSYYKNTSYTKKEDRWQDVRLDPQNVYQDMKRHAMAKSNPHPPITTAYPSNPVGKTAGILYTVFGWILMPISGIAILVLTMLSFILNNMSLFGTIALGISPLFIIGLFLTIRGSTIRARLRRFYRYIGLFKEKSYYSIQDLSAQTQSSRKSIAKDLKKMIAIGMFPEGHIDKKATCIMLNQESYRQYLQLQQNMQMQEPDNKRTQGPLQGKDLDKEKAETKTNFENKELQIAIENGRQCILQIREANDAIPGEEISAKLDRLEMVVDKIFTHVERNPLQLTEINKFMEYYLPTTLKLVTTYKEFDLQPVQGDNIRLAKSEIEKTLDTINQAFETLLDSLFEDAAMDISTDISVLETMLAQEGLTKNKLNLKK